MLKRLLTLVFACATLAATTGCAVNRATANVMPDADLGKVKSLYVVKDPKDERGIDELIKKNLAKRGYQVEGGLEQAPPYKADAVVTYLDKWMWDITMYMIELTITVRNPQNFPMASGNSLHTSLTRKSPDEMVDEVLTNILNAKK
ncbi:hypothetical protein [Ideonella sp.]|uniref:hypothetical protein n=1 Tax=Ideonella sp. TaxID=1929293 RepID=UPI002B4741A4|nr:hypothetical protein [Ideonella sp.]HJV72227.1 hypothetical protein [Ideonella sp.]